MNWNIAQAKQRFSEVVKQAGEAPQLIYNRNTPVAAVIAAEELAAYQIWKESTQARSSHAAEDFAQLRELLAESGDSDGLDIPGRQDRPNAFEAALEEHPPQ